MNDKFFMDSNILIYTFDSHAPRKQEKARELVGAALRFPDYCGCITG
jgi:predicted nucleic acid-binding protein